MGKRGPKTKYDPSTHPNLVRWMCRSGLSNEQIAEELGINVATLYRWQNDYPEICEALKLSRDMVDHLVEDSLLKRALGYEVEETKITGGKDGKPVKIEKTKKHVEPNTTAIIFWLKNRQKEKWRDRTEVEHAGAVSVNSDLEEKIVKSEEGAEALKTLYRLTTTKEPMGEAGKD